MWREIRGLKFPDEYIVKHFFKMGLHRLSGRVLELGCANGNNLLLYFDYGWRVTGIDLSEQALADARHNFAAMGARADDALFIQCDFSKTLPATIRGKFDVLLLPNFLNYLRRSEAHALLLKASRFVRSGTHVFLRTRSIRDYRYRRGKLVEGNSYRMTTDETGERGCLNTCYQEHELVALLQHCLHISQRSLQVMTIDAVNLHQGIPLLNSDIVIWGQVNHK